jgi:GNAT superfamily N-acetyltransferase
MFLLLSVSGPLQQACSVSPRLFPFPHQLQHIFRYELTAQQLEYRLRTCGELCSGLFASAYATSPGPLAALLKARKFPSVDSADADRKRLLLGHIVATKHSSPLVTDHSMEFPTDWRTNYQLTPSVGHNEDGETVCLHSLCVHPDLQAKGIGAVLLRGWTQRIKDAGVAKRIALLCREHLVTWYEKAGFEKVGPSNCQYGGGGWIDMVMEFDKTVDDDDI